MFLALQILLHICDGGLPAGFHWQILNLFEFHGFLAFRVELEIISRQWLLAVAILQLD